MKRISIIFAFLLSVFISVSIYAAGTTQFVTCNDNGEVTGTVFSKATITVSSIDTSGNYLYKGIDVGVFKRGQSDSIYQKRVLTNTLKVQITDFGESSKYNSSDIYVLGYRVLYSLIDNEDGSIVETGWKMIDNNTFKLNTNGEPEKKEINFSDIGANHWAYEALKSMFARGIISGYDDGTFRPDEKITREQFAKLLVNSCNVSLITPDAPGFEDINKDDWSYSYVESVKPFMDGYKIRNKMYFKGTVNITREQAISAIVRAKGLRDDSVDTKEINVFKDSNQISSKYLKDMIVAYKNKFVEGDEGNLNPKGNLTRAEAAMLLYRIMK